MLRFALLALALPALGFAASLLEQKIDQLLRTTPAVEPGAVGVQIVQLGTGKVLYSRNAGKLLTPASNTKLFTTALALTELGPDYKIPTRVFSGPDGDLVLAGRGDPSMSFIPIPYSKDAPVRDPNSDMDALAADIAAQGVRTIVGDVVGDDTAFPADLFPPGWALDDAVWDYGAPVSALNFAGNSIRVTLEPGAHAGDPATVNLLPAVDYMVIENRIRTAETGSPDVNVRRIGEREFELTGTISIEKGPAILWLAADDPALYAATALYDALARRGITITGQPRARHRYESTTGAAASGQLIIERMSPALAELLRVTDKVSQNLWAELMLRQVALAKTGNGSRRAGLDCLRAFLSRAGIADTDYAFHDGSGLSRMTLVKPEAIVKLLQFMYASQHRVLWIGLLPVGGEDGSLEKRFSKDPAAKNIHAKTGSLSHVNALSGYADSATYGEVAFAIVVNHTIAPSAEIRAFIDKIGMILLE